MKAVCCSTCVDFFTPPERDPCSWCVSLREHPAWRAHDNIVQPQPDPKPSDAPASWDLVMADMAARKEFGRNKYGVLLQPNNGRDALADAYQEALDLAVYLRTAIYERDGK